MQPYPSTLQTFSFGAKPVQLRVPDMQLLRHNYETALSAGSAIPFPYWAKLWPSAIALCQFITANPALIQDKEVLELAAGLGLPGFVAAGYAAHITTSDYAPEAVTMLQAATELNGYNNVSCRLLNWSALPPDLAPDTLLLSDINYEPAAFDVLFRVLLHFLDKGTCIVLTTPQRLMARPFVERLLPYCSQQEEIAVTLEQEEIHITILVLQQAVGV